MATSAWALSGNAGTSPVANFVGTSDNQPLVIKTVGSECVRVDTSGNVGIGTTTPGSQLHVNVAASANPIGGLTVDVQSFGTEANAQASYFLQVRDIGAAPPNGLTHLLVRGDGYVGIGTPNPASSLDVNGDISINGVDAIRRDPNNAYIFPFGTQTASNNVIIGGGPGGNTNLQVTGNVSIGGEILLSNADCAEQFDANGFETPEPGTVVVIDDDGALIQSRDAYDKKVAGVVSGAGDYRPGILLDRQAGSAARIPVSLVGKVYCKVDAQYGSVEVGDLLTTSPTPGHAMKVTEPARAFGAVIGKALKAWTSGTGLVPILIALQ